MDNLAHHANVHQRLMDDIHQQQQQHGVVTSQPHHHHHSNHPHKFFPPPPHVQQRAWIQSYEQYLGMYRESVEKPHSFWGKIASENYYWKEKGFSLEDPKSILDYNMDVSKGPIRIEWFKNSLTNICYNALDRHVLNGNGDRVAFYFEGNDINDPLTRTVTYKQLLEQVSKFAKVLKKLGVQKGDCVAMYMPMVMELIVAVLACARIGAIHSVVFGGFSAEALSQRLIDSHAKVIVTADYGIRGDKLIPLKHSVDEAIDHHCSERGFSCEKVIVVNRMNSTTTTTRSDSHDDDDDSGHDTLTCSHNKSTTTTHTTTTHTTTTATTTTSTTSTTSTTTIQWHSHRDVWYHDLMGSLNDDDDSELCPVEWVRGEDPLFMLYTSGSTGKPKGLIHTTAGYMIYTSTTFKYVFDYHEGDVYWCGADIGWITGHSYVVYGPLLCGATSVIFEGVPTYPTASRCWQIIDKYQVNQFYSAPTLIRTLMKMGDSYVKEGSSRESLRVLGSVGEPINPEAWMWYHQVVGNSKCAIVDTFWQTESGGHLITPLPGCIPTKPGSATVPFFGVVPVVLNTTSCSGGSTSSGCAAAAHSAGTTSDNCVQPPHFEPPTPTLPATNDTAASPSLGSTYSGLFSSSTTTTNPSWTTSLELQGECEGYLAMKYPWPGIARTIFGDHERYEKTYFGIVNGYYMTGDGCKRDSDGYIWLTGRVDDVLNVSGHRLGTAELESAFVAHPSVAEAAVVPCPHDIKGHGIYCYVVLKDHVNVNDKKQLNELAQTLKHWIRHEIGPVATPDYIHFALKGLPKTRSGKIMRRILRKIAEGSESSLGDVSTLADPSVVEDLIATRVLK
ncbi:hypothetical protein FDP41_009286 [Naegleria fowleri]|uniref:acetate--CoA ligase n=1 Tax=Naegleria fowleri TaxID=5763 RepID=A0A6A5AXD0_NAEFO|nr:uncharacterized protein FDP41_009286 [Naegleria fowleri]KAF0972383.1 hypothetical protein FDP41_009286 [Naegleria fowleri]CAG4716500.1 unnamed protein product [Naegleria fowleri]